MALTQVNGGMLDSVAQQVGFRNRIINGAGQIWQRGTTISNIPASGTTPTYIADRWCLANANTGWTGVAQAVQVSGGGIRINCTTAAAYNGTTGDVFYLNQRIEGLNSYDLSGQQVTVSFKLKTNKTGNYGVTLYADNTAVWNTPQSITVSSSGVETTYSLTFTAQTGIVANTNEGLRLVITLGANTGRAGVFYPTGGSQVNLLDNTANYLEIREVQLEKGSTATSFDYRPYGTELALCQRYFCFQGGESDYAFFANGVGRANSATRSSQCFNFPVTMRAAPSISSVSITSTAVGPSAVTAISIDQATTKNISLYVDVASGLTTGQAVNWYANGTQVPRVQYSAEL